MARIETSTNQEYGEWPKTLWPVTKDIFSQLPEELRPDYESIQALNYPWEILELIRSTMRERITQTRIEQSAQLSEKSEIVGPVWVASGVKVFSFSSIVGPSYIGAGVIIGNQSLVRESFVGSRTIVGAYTELARDVIGEDCTFHKTFVGDSLLAQRVEFSGLTGALSFRPDRKNSTSTIDGSKLETGLEKLGVIVGAGSIFSAGSITMPGTKIGKSCVIGPGVRVYEDLPDNTRCIVRQKLEMRTQADRE